jgi:hypothetical protein
VRPASRPQDSRASAPKSYGTVRHGDVEKDDWLPAVPRLPRAAGPLRSSLFRDTTTPLEHTSGYLEVSAGPGGYVLRDRQGRCPAEGDRVEDEEGSTYVVLKVGRSPLANDLRRCAYLISSNQVA